MDDKLLLSPPSTTETTIEPQLGHCGPVPSYSVKKEMPWTQGCRPPAIPVALKTQQLQVKKLLTAFPPPPSLGQNQQERNRADL